jgi:hypothetical protein
MDIPTHEWEGRWFRCLMWWVYPKKLEPEAQARARAHAEDFYNTQPEWKLSELETSCSDEGEQMAAEFIDAVRHASRSFGEFSWFLFRDFSHLNWRAHAWKHIASENLEHVGRDVLHPLDLEMRLDGMSESAFKDLLSRAKQKDLSAVIRLTQLFPYENEIQQAVESYIQEHDLEWSLEWNFGDLPSAGDLAKQLVDQMFRESDKAQEFRGRLVTLTSDRAVKGSEKSIRSKAKGAGRPGKTLQPEPLEILLLMGDAIFIQLREVNGLLKRRADSREERERFLRHHYPWIEKLRVEGKDESHEEPLSELLKMPPQKAAVFIASAILDVSTSKIDKDVRRGRSRNRGT